MLSEKEKIHFGVSIGRLLVRRLSEDNKDGQGEKP